MKSFIHFLAFFPLVFAEFHDEDDTTVTVTKTRTHTICPCENTNWATWKASEETAPVYSIRSTSIYVWPSTSIETTTSTTIEDGSDTSSTTSTSISDAETTTSTTTSLDTTTTSSTSTSTTDESTTSTSSSTSTSASTTSSSTTPGTTSTSSTTSSVTASSSTTTSSTPAGTVVNPGTNFTPSAEISNGRLAKRARVYIDMNTNANAGRITTSVALATTLQISTQGVLETTLRSYPNICGTSNFNSAPSLFYCDNSGGLPRTYKGWTNSPVFRYMTWTFCYKTDLTLYMLESSTPPADCTPITFTADFSANA